MWSFSFSSQKSPACTDKQHRSLFSSRWRMQLREVGRRPPLHWKHLDQAIALFHPVVGVGVDALFARFFVVGKKIISTAPKKIPTTYLWACLHWKRISRNPEGAFFSFPLTSTSKTLSFIILQTATGVGTIYGITSTILKVFQNPSSYLAFKRIHMPAESF